MLHANVIVCAVRSLRRFAIEEDIKKAEVNKISFGTCYTEMTVHIVLRFNANL